MSDNKSWAICSRDQKRLLLTEDDEVQVEIGGPRFELTGVSEAGISFAVSEGTPFPSGTVVDAVVIHIGGFDVRGRLEVVHLTHEKGEPTVCGAKFDAASEDELRKLREGMKEVESARSR